MANPFAEDFEPVQPERAAQPAPAARSAPNPFEEDFEPAPTGFAGAARTVAQGLTGGLSDEAEAALRGAYAAATSDKSYGQAYGESLAEARQSIKGFGEAHPYLATGLEIAGAAPTMLIPGLGGARAATMAGRLGKGAVQGAEIGGIYGFGSGEGGFQNRLAGAGEGALLGAGVGAGAELVAPAVGGLVSGVKASGSMVGNAFDTAASLRASADEKLARAIRRNTTDSGSMSPQGAAQWLTEQQAATALGPKSQPKPDMLPLTLADVGTGTQRLARAVAGVPGLGSDVARKELFARHKGQFGRMYDQFKQSLGVASADYFKTEAKVLAEQKAASDPAYKKAFLGQQRFDLTSALGKWKLQSSIEGGDLQNALNKAIGIVQKQLRTDPYSIGALRGTQPLAKPIVKRDEMSPLTGAFKVVPAKPPAWMPLRSFDGAKRAIDSMIEKFIARGANSEVRLLTMFKNDLLKEVDAANPLYANARQEFSSRAELLDALRLGRKAFTGDTEVTATAFKDLSTAEKKMFKIGMAQEARKSYAGKRFGEDLALMFDRPASKELFENVMSKEKFGRYQTMSEAESRMAQTKNIATGNSQTAEKLADRQDLNMFQSVGKAIADKGLTGAAMSGIGDFIQRMFQMREAEAHLLAKDLFEKDPIKLKATLDRIQGRYGLGARQRLQQQMASYVAKPLRLVGAEQAGLSEPRKQKPPQRADGGYVSSSIDALSRIPSDVRQYVRDLPENKRDADVTIPQRAIEGTNYAIDAGLRGVSGNRWSLPWAFGLAGLPTSSLEQGIKDFGERNAAGIKALGDIGNATLGAGTPAGIGALAERTPAAVAKAVEPGGIADRAATAFERGAAAAGDPSKSNIFIGYVGAGNLAKVGRPAAQEALAMAERLKDEGRTPEEIWKTTSDHLAARDPELAGVHYGADGKPRIEINDSYSSFNQYALPSSEGVISLASRRGKELGLPYRDVADPKMPRETVSELMKWASDNMHLANKPTVPLSRLLRHDELFQAYPQYGDINVGQETSSSLYGSQRGNTITVGGGPLTSQGNPHGTALHEVQHAIQDSELFGKGANPKSFSIPEKAITRILMGIGELPTEGSAFSGQLVNAAKRTFPEFKGSSLKDVQTFVRTGQLAGRLPAKIESISSDISRNIANDMYMRTSGEVESRNVQKRMHMKANERRDTPPWLTQDVPFDKQVVRYPGGNPAPASSGAFDDILFGQ